MLSFLSASLCLAFAGALPSSSSNPFASDLAPPHLNALAQAAGKMWFGTAVDIPDTAEISTPEYMTIANDSQIFGQLTPANSMKFINTEPEQNVFNFTGGDRVVAIAKENGNRFVRCHNLVWASQISEWVLDGNFSAAELTQIMKNHITTLITHFGDSCFSWDVVNEALDQNGNLTSSIWFDTIGPNYFFDAFQFAQEAVEKTGKDIKLFYNDFNIESPGSKADGVVTLIKELQSRNIRIDGIGLESHFEVGAAPTAAQQVQAMEMYTALGLDVAITELDVRFTSLPFNSAGLVTQAQNYFAAPQACLQVEGCIGITVWDFVDEFSWVPGTFPGQGGADLLGMPNSLFERKPAFTAVGDALSGQACSVC